MLTCTLSLGHTGRHRFRREGGEGGCPSTLDVGRLESLDSGSWDGTCQGCGQWAVPSPHDLCRDCQVAQVRILETRRGPVWSRYGGRHVYVMGG